MKKLLLPFVLLLSVSCYGQESFKKKYYVKKSRDLKKDTTIKFEDLLKSQQDSIRNFYKNATNVTYTVPKGSDKVMVAIVDKDFYKSQGVKKSIVAKLPEGETVYAFVKFDEDKVIVNPYLKDPTKKIFENSDLYYYQLKNREAIRLSFTEFNVNTLAIPIKYRFRDKKIGLQEEFTTAVNVNFFGGFSFGRSRFFHQEKVGNITNTWKLTAGFLLGASTVKLDNSNTSLAAAPMAAGTEITKGLATMGIGSTYSYNKINVGAFLGWDYSIGQNAKMWNYNRKPWLGIAIGYSLFSL